MGKDKYDEAFNIGVILYLIATSTTTVFVECYLKKTDN
jgi:hypothetical protein